MPEWLVERGIGETRAVLIEKGEIVEARIELEGIVPAGTVIAARLVNSGTNGRNAVARDEQVCEYLLPRGAPGVTEGGKLKIEITRSAIPGGEPWKRPSARVADQPSSEPARPSGRELGLPSPRDELGEAGWNELIEEARSGVVRFTGGELRIETTSAMTMIDVDGNLGPDELALLGAAEAAKAIRRLDIGGSIGIDLPTVGSRTTRQSAASAIDRNLPQPFERTAVNGFGFVQIVRPRNRASLIEMARDRAAFEARALLRRMAFEPPGPKLIVAHPSLSAVLAEKPAWLDQLAGQIGGAISLRADPSLPISGAYATSG